MAITTDPPDLTDQRRRPGDMAVTVGGILFAIGATAVVVAFVGYLVFGVQWDRLGVVVPAVGLLMALGLAAALVGLLQMARSRSAA